MSEKKVMVCMCENCGNEAEMTIKCEEVVAPETPARPAAAPEPEQVKRTLVCSNCGNEANMIVSPVD
jgi:transcription elongation factor Elf1